LGHLLGVLAVGRDRGDQSGERHDQGAEAFLPPRLPATVRRRASRHAAERRSDAVRLA
jgi:hypothetical protein